MMPTVDLVYFNAGGGHRAAAQALHELFLAQQRPWNVRLVNLTEVIDRGGALRRLIGVDPEKLYNRLLRAGWTIGMSTELRLLQAGIRLAHPLLRRLLDAHWLATEPDLVVSLVPNFNRALCESLACTLPGVPFATVMTDLADLPPRFWIEPDQPQHLICGTAHACDQALAAGVAPRRVRQVSGMVLRPSFYRESQVDRVAARRALGLDPTRLTAVVLYGGHGSTQMLQIARLLPELQLVFMVGHNVALGERLRGMPAKAPRAVVGFTPAVAEVLRLGDFFIGKPGPGSLSEALHLGLPVVTFENASTMPQERYNARWVREQGVGLVVSSLRALPAAVEAAVATLPSLSAKVATLSNRAFYEVADILAELLSDDVSLFAQTRPDCREMA